MVSSNDEIFTIVPSRVTIAPGATNAYFLDVFPGEKNLTIKYLSGGTLEILPCTLGVSLPVGNTQYGSGYFTAGTTQTAAMLISLSGSGYLMGNTEVLTFDGSPRCYLSALGATTMVTIMKSCGNGI